MSSFRFTIFGVAAVLSSLVLPRLDAAAGVDAEAPAKTCTSAQCEDQPGTSGPALMQQQWQLQVPGAATTESGSGVSIHGAATETAIPHKSAGSRVSLDLMAGSVPVASHDFSLLARAEQRGLLQHTSNSSAPLTISDLGLKDLKDLEWWQRLLLSLGTVTVITLFVLICAAAPKSEPAKESTPEVKELEDQVETLAAEKKKLAAEVADLNSQISAAIESGKTPEPELTTAELWKKADEIAQIGDDGLRKKYSEALMTVAPVVIKAQKLKQKVQDRIEKTKDGAKSIVVDKATQLADTVMEKLEINYKTSDLAKEVLENDMERSASDIIEKDGGVITDAALQAADIEIPSAPMLLAGLLAPIRLQVLIIWNRIALFLGLPMLLILAGVAAYDVGLPCEGGGVWIWAIAMLTIMGLTSICRLWVLHGACTVLADIKHEDVHEQWHSADSWIVNMKKRMIEDSTDFFKGLVGYDSVVNSGACKILSVLNVFYTIFGLTGIFFSIWFIVADSKTCEADGLLFLMHFLSFIYVLNLTFTIPLLVLEIAGAVIDNTPILENIVLSVAKNVDKQHPENYPIATLFARAFFMGSVTKIHEAEAKSLQVDLDELNAKMYDLRNKQYYLNSDLETKTRRYHAMLKAKQDADPEVKQTAEELQAEAKEYAENAMKKAQDMGVDLGVVIAKVHEEMAARAAETHKQAEVLVEQSKKMGKQAQAQAQEALAQAKDQKDRLQTQAKDSATAIKKQRSGRCRSQ